VRRVCKCGLPGGAALPLDRSSWRVSHAINAAAGHNQKPPPGFAVVDRDVSRRRGRKKGSKSRPRDASR